MNRPSSPHDKGGRRSRLEQGKEFEGLAAKFYADQGFEIRARNWRAGRKEIDLIVSREKLLIFVEVKSSTTKKFGHPAERVDRRKQNNLIEAARQYLLAENIKDYDLRFDVVTFSSGQLEHFPDAFRTDD